MLSANVIRIDWVVNFKTNFGTCTIIGNYSKKKKLRVVRNNSQFAMKKFRLWPEPTAFFLISKIIIWQSSSWHDWIKRCKWKIFKNMFYIMKSLILQNRYFKNWNDVVINGYRNRYPRIREILWIFDRLVSSFT